MLWKECLESRRENFLFQEVVTKVCQKGVVFEERCRGEQNSEAYLTHIGPYVVVITSWETKSWDDMIRNHVKNVSVEEYLFFLRYVIKWHVMSWIIPLFFCIKMISFSLLLLIHEIMQLNNNVTEFILLGLTQDPVRKKIVFVTFLLFYLGTLMGNFLIINTIKTSQTLGSQCISSFSTCPYLIPASLLP